MKWFAAVAAIALSTLACSRQESVSGVTEMARTSKILHLKNGAHGATQGDFIKFSEITYTVYETGRIDLHGDVSFKVPLIDVELDLPFTKTYRTSPANVLSDSYRAVTTEQPLQVDRLSVDVVKVSDDLTKARAKAQINRTFYWTDLFWGFDLVTLDLDLTSKVVGIDRIEVKKGYVYYDAKKRIVLPYLNWWEDPDNQNNNGDDDGNGDGNEDGGEDGIVPQDVNNNNFGLAQQDTPQQIIERESNDESKIYHESVLVFE